MSTTTIRLPDELKARVAEAARREGVSTHAFLLQAIEQRTAQLEAQQDFLRTAQRRLAEWDRNNESIPWDEMRQYVLDRAAGKKPARPHPRQTPGRGRA
jgi:predicted transcriptional regulator